LEIHPPADFLVLNPLEYAKEPTFLHWEKPIKYRDSPIRKLYDCQYGIMQSFKHVFHSTIKTLSKPYQDKYATYPTT
jgi:hypothetical protein